MPFSRRHISKQPSKHAKAVTHAFYGGTDAPEAPKSRKTGKQPEGLVNKAIGQWAALHPELMIGRNKRRLATPPGMSEPIMLGWMIDGSSDWIGYRSIVITPAMLNKRIAVFCAFEAKTETNGPSKDQETFIKAVLEAGGLAGVARNAEDCEAIAGGDRTRVK